MNPRVAAVVLAALLLAAGCARVPPPVASPTTPTTQTISFAYWALEPAEGALTRSLIGRFEQAHPGIAVRVEEIPGRYYEKLAIMFAGGTAPDVLVVNYGRLGDFAKRGVLADLGGLGATQDLRADEFLPGAWRAFAEAGPVMGRDGLYGLPVDWSPTNLLLYDPDALAAAGVEAPVGSWSWEEFGAACRKLSGAQQRGAAVCLYPYAAAAWLEQGGGRLLGPDGQSALDTQANLRAVTFVKGLAEAKLIVPPDPSQDRSLEEFQSGRAAMAFVTPYVLGALQRSDSPRRWALALPLHDRRRVTGCIPSGVAVTAKCAHPQAAAELARYWATEASAARAEAGWAVPAYLPALRGPGLEQAVGAAAAEVLRQAAALASPHPLSPQLPYERTSGSLRTALEQVFCGQLPPRQALTAAEAKLRAESGRQSGAK